MMRTILVAYMPVLHAGYYKLIEHTKPSAVYLIADEILNALPDEFDYVRRKDAIRAISAMQMAEAIEALFPDVICIVADAEICKKAVTAKDTLVVMPDEDVSRAVAERYFPQTHVLYAPVFLRWDRDAVSKQESAAALADVRVSHELLDEAFMRKSADAAKSSADWWRQLGGALVKDGMLLYIACNQHTPHPQAPYAFGDPRNLFKRGIRIEYSTAEHAEGALIAEAARQGVSTEGASIYVTTFPCPMCARLIAHSGIKRCYFSSGYSVLDGADEMRRHGVELVYVDLKQAPRD